MRLLRDLFVGGVVCFGYLVMVDFCLLLFCFAFRLFVCLLFGVVVCMMVFLVCLRLL